MLQLNLTLDTLVVSCSDRAVMCRLSWILCAKQERWIAEQCTGAEVACSSHCVCIALAVTVLDPLLG